MSRLIVGAFSISIDGYGAGLDKSLDHPLGGDSRPGHLVDAHVQLQLVGFQHGSESRKEVG